MLARPVAPAGTIAAVPGVTPRAAWCFCFEAISAGGRSPDPGRRRGAELGAGGPAAMFRNMRGVK